MSSSSALAVGAAPGLAVTPSKDPLGAGEPWRGAVPSCSALVDSRLVAAMAVAPAACPVAGAKLRAPSDMDTRYDPEVEQLSRVGKLLLVAKALAQVGLIGSPGLAARFSTGAGVAGALRRVLEVCCVDSCSAAIMV